MAEQQFDNEGNPIATNDPASQEGGEQQWLKDLRRKAREYEGLEHKLKTYEQRDAVRAVDELKALSDKQVQALLATAPGESNPDTWKQTAEELGFWKPTSEVDPQVQAGHEQVAAASQGAQVSPSVPDGSDPYAGANSPSEVMAIAQKRGSATTWG